ncbi:MAG TPA: hypothetical protein VMH26_19035 [Burkholderiales bacterium]|nr:hypothetical protein [Burkholderiales bacterium]
MAPSFPRRAHAAAARRGTGPAGARPRAYVVQALGGNQLDRALAIAETIARQSPVGVQATLASARLALREGERSAFERMLPDLQRVMATDDAVEGLKAFLERREPRF